MGSDKDKSRLDEQKSREKQKVNKVPRQAHDTYFKAAFSDLDVSRDVLMQQLPKDLVAHCDWNTLCLECSHVQSKILREKIADIIFSVKTKDQGDLKVLYHVEHLSRPKRWVILYCWSIIFEYLYTLREKEGVKKLPLMIPLIMYQNPKPFPHSTDICDLFEQPELARKYVFKPIQLYEICQMIDEEVSRHDKSGLVQMTMKHIYSSDFSTIFPVRLAPYLRLVIKNDRLGAKQLLLQTLSYIECKARIPNKENFARMVSEIDNELEAAMLTMAQQYRKEGKLEGRLEGEKIGVAKGKLSVVLSMLRDRLKPDFIARYTNISVPEVRRLALDYNLLNQEESEEV